MPNLDGIPPALRARMAAAYAAPMTHRVATLFADGRAPRFHDCRSLDIAEGHASRERRKLGRELIASDGTGAKVRVVGVVIGAL